MLHHVNIFIHVLFGVIAMLIGILPYATKKGSEKHRLSGRIFLGFMAIVILTALNGVFFFRDRPFLTVVAFQSLYFSYSGYRMLKTKSNGFQWVDFAVMFFIGSVAISFLFKLKTANILWDLSVVYYILFYLLAIIAFDMLRFFLPHLIRNKRFWIYDHIYKMTGAFTALVSAGIGTVMAAWEPWNQILPAGLGTLWLVFCLVYFPRKVG